MLTKPRSTSNRSKSACCCAIARIVCSHRRRTARNDPFKSLTFLNLDKTIKPNRHLPPVCNSDESTSTSPIASAFVVVVVDRWCVLADTFDAVVLLSQQLSNHNEQNEKQRLPETVEQSEATSVRKRRRALQRHLLAFPLLNTKNCYNCFRNARNEIFCLPASLFGFANIVPEKVRLKRTVEFKKQIESNRKRKHSYPSE